MSTENLTAFLDKVSQDESLAAKVAALHAEADETLVLALVALSEEVGTPITAETLRQQATTLLSDTALSQVSGGGGNFLPFPKSLRPRE